jgi:hypothetical protein
VKQWAKLEKGVVESGAEREGMELAHMDERSVDETMRMIARIPAPEGLGRAREGWDFIWLEEVTGARFGVANGEAP